MSKSSTHTETITGSRFSAFLYGPTLWWGERAGNAERRRALVAAARGCVLEVGAGTGHNLAHYPPGLERLVLAEPEANMARRLERRLAKLGGAAEVVRAPAEALPFDDATFDTAVCTFVLCTVADPMVALREIARVLRPGGSLLFLEHVRSPEEKLSRRQDRLHGPWKSFADGCNCNRRTVESISEAGFDVLAVDRAAWRRMPSIVRPLASGTARATHGGRRRD